MTFYIEILNSQKKFENFKNKTLRYIYNLGKSDNLNFSVNNIHSNLINSSEEYILKYS